MNIDDLQRRHYKTMSKHVAVEYSINGVIIARAATCKDYIAVAIMDTNTVYRVPSFDEADVIVLEWVV